MEKLTFHFGIFYNEMVNTLKRDPDMKHCYGWGGYYEFWYKPRNEEEGRFFKKKAEILKAYLDGITDILPDFRCEFGKPIPPHSEDSKDDKDMLQIRINIDMSKR